MGGRGLGFNRNFTGQPLISDKPQTMNRIWISGFLIVYCGVHFAQAQTDFPVQTQSAAEWYLGENLDALTAQLEAQWSQSIAPEWTQRHQELSQAREKLVAIEEKAQAGPLSDEEEWLRADATEDFGDEDAAFALYQDYLQTHPDQGRAHFSVGRLMLKRGDEAGLEHFERAIALEHEATAPAAQLAESFLLQRQRTDEASQWRERGLQYEDKLAHAQAERAALAPNDTLLPHQLPSGEIEKLREHFARFEAVQEIYIARKDVQHFPDWPLFVVGVTMEKKKLTVSSDETRRTQAFVTALEELEFEHNCLWLQLDAEGGRAFLKPLKKVENSLIYTKNAG